jgi:predicted phosphoribosyltransferase
MYFASRMQAGRTLAKKLVPKYRYENCVVIALDDGGAVVGAQIASKLHCLLTLMLIEQITLPRENQAVGAVIEDGSFTYNQAFSQGELEEIVSENRSYIEQGKLEGMHHINQILGKGSLIRHDLIKGRNVILVSDGLQNGFPLDLAMTFLKPISIEKLIVATPLATVKAVDRMHILADEICCIDVLESEFDTKHYYDKQDVPEHEVIVETLSKNIFNWK